MIITIDGPAGTGKSTAARSLAERLGFAYLDTGAMYRAVGLACLRRGVSPDDEAACGLLMRTVSISVDGQRTWLDGEDVSEEIRSLEVTSAASEVAKNGGVRAALVDLQRSIALTGDYVCEGRDQGTVAFPDAEIKFYVSATPEVRAERRRQELLTKGADVPGEELLRQITERDQRDQERAVSPLRPADDAIEIDTTDLDSEAVLARLETEVRAKLAPR
ncbi:MAG: (d)CMP kinase [Planctomycetaceae bacterium]